MEFSDLTPLDDWEIAELAYIEYHRRDRINLRAKKLEHRDHWCASQYTTAIWDDNYGRTCIRNRGHTGKHYAGYSEVYQAIWWETD